MAKKNLLPSNLYNKKGEKFYCLEMFPYPSEKFIWVTLEITL